jgi:aromatic ring-opening dioxygenase catalytic subunit (LigB family)
LHHENFSVNYHKDAVSLKKPQMAAKAAVSRKAVSIFINHGGGPMPILKDPGHMELTSFLMTKGRLWLGKPKAIVLVTAHWETKITTISSSDKHSLLYDYYNFPKEAYTVEYNAPGSGEIAAKVQTIIVQNGVESVLDSKRGWDHGVFVPLILLSPEANIPVIQVSVLQSQDAAELLKVGKALSGLRDDGIAIVGSGMSFHNMAAFRGGVGNNAGNVAFEEVLQESAKLERDERIAKLKDWKSFPNALDCHPRNAAEHFSPFLVAAAAGEKLKEVDTIDLWGWKLSAYCFE